METFQRLSRKEKYVWDVRLFTTHESGGTINDRLVLDGRSLRRRARYCTSIPEYTTSRG